jgi:hypothetical protein
VISRLFTPDDGKVDVIYQALSIRLDAGGATNIVSSDTPTHYRALSG